MATTVCMGSHPFLLTVVLLGLASLFVLNQLRALSVEPGTAKERVFVPYHDKKPAPSGKNAITKQNNNDMPREFFHVLPKRLISIFGLESSGTTFVTKTLAAAIDADYARPAHSLVMRMKEKPRDVEINHLCLPWGGFHTPGLKNGITPTQLIEFLPPLECMVYSWYEDPNVQKEKMLEPPHPHCFNETGLRERVPIPERFYVNITSHVRWYQDRGVPVTAVVVVRDDYAHFHGKLKYTNSQVSAMQEDLQGKKLIVDALQHLSTFSNDKLYPELVMVSYETLMSLRKPYLFDIYDRLGIHSTYVPKFSNGNRKYIQPPDGSTEWDVDPGVQAQDEGR